LRDSWILYCDIHRWRSCSGVHGKDWDDRLYLRSHLQVGWGWSQWRVSVAILKGLSRYDRNRINRWYTIWPDLWPGQYVTCQQHKEDCKGNLQRNFNWNFNELFRIKLKYSYFYSNSRSISSLLMAQVGEYLQRSKEMDWIDTGWIVCEFTQLYTEESGMI
jgi:hypothetical protein